MQTLEQPELFEVPVDNRYAELRSTIRYNIIAQGLYYLALKDVLKLSETFGIIEGRVLEVAQEEFKKHWKKMEDFGYDKP